MGARRAVTVVGMVLAISLASCTSGPRIVDRTKLEQGIIDQSTSSDHPIASVTCPPDRALAEGDSFTCEATLVSGESVTIDATQKDGDGTVAWDRHEAIVDGPQFVGIENGVLSREYGATITLACPERILVNDGDTFTCQGTDERGHVRTVTFTAVHPRDGEFTHVVDGLPPPTSTTTSTAAP